MRKTIFLTEINRLDIQENPRQWKTGDFFNNASLNTEGGMH